MKKVLWLVLILVLVSCGKKKEESGIANTPPFVEKIKILPEHPRVGSRAALRIEAGDRENDVINYRVVWFLNGNAVGEGLEFYLPEVSSGDSLFVEVTPNDGKLSGATARSPVVIFGNTPPQIIGARISPDTILSSTDDLTVIGEGFDQDGDSLRWLCYWILNYSERIVDSSTTLSLKNLNLEKGAHLTAELYAYDGDTVSTPYLLEIDVVNAPPMLKAGLDSVRYSPNGLEYQVPIADPDGDVLTFELLEGPEGVTIDPTRGIISGGGQDSTNFDIVVRATDSDGAYLDARFTITPPR